MEQSILELVLNYYRSPSQYPELVDIDAPLPQGIDFLLELVSEKVELNTDELQGDLKGVSVKELKAASVFYIEHVFFNSNANFYRTLGLNSNATQNQIRHHYSALIHILCLDQEDKAADWDEAYAMQINRAYSVLRIPDKREKYNKQNDIVASGFSGVEKRSESRKVLDGDSSEPSIDGASSSGERGRISSSFIAANIDRAYLSKDNKPAETVVVAKDIDSASPENLYEPDEIKAHSEQNKEAESGAIIADKKTTVETGRSNVDELPSKMGLYSLLGVLFLVAMVAAFIYFSGSLQPELDVLDSDEYKTTVSETEEVQQEPVEIVEKINNTSDDNTIVDDVDVDLDKVENIEVAEPEEKNDAVVDETAPADQEISDVKNIVEPSQLADLDIVTENIETINEIAEFEQENLDSEAVEFFETDDAPELTDAADEWLYDSISDEDMLVDNDDLTEFDQEMEAETSVEDMNTEKLSAVVRDFIRYYNSGDLDQFIKLFAEDAKTDDRENRSGIQEDYADAFNLTVKRKFLIDDVQWVMLDENNGLGTADFVLFIQALGEDRFAEYTGEITFYIENRDDALLITGLYHQYSE